MPGDAVAVTRLLALLDYDVYAERERAQRALEKMGEGVVHLLRKAREGKVSPEARRRLNALVRKASATSPLRMQQHRAVALLEWIGTPAARTLLRTLAEGAPGAQLTIEARAALKGLQS